MAGKRDYWKVITGETYKESTRRPTFEQTLDDQWSTIHTKYPLRTLGYGTKALRITEEERPHIHLIGSTQEGKSKFIEHLIRGDIKRGIGLCLLDPTTGGKTVYDVLRYCAFKKLKKVCLIDPYHRFEYNVVPGINPFLYAAGKRSDKLKETSIKDIIDTVRILFNQKDPSETPRIERYLPAVLNVLYDAQRPLRDAKYFTNREYKDERDEMLQFTDADTRLDLEEAFRNQMAYVSFQSTVNRLGRFFKGTLGLMFTPQNGIDFMKMVSEGWVILVNLDAGMGFDTLDSRLLGTLIINEIQTSIERLNKKGFTKPYYLYIDEASEYANRKLARTLSLKQKTGLKMTISHQYTKQFEDPYVLNSILGNTKLKVMFNLPMKADRDLMSSNFYKDMITPDMASDANSDLPKQYAVMKALKGSPMRVRIPDVKEPPVTDEQLQKYILSLYKQDWYYTAKELKENEPPRPERTNRKTAGPRTPADRKPGRAPRVPNDGSKTNKWKDVS